MGTADYGQPTDPLSTPSLSQWAEAVHLDAQATDSEQAAQDARLDVLEAERSLGDLDDVNVTDLPPADGDRLAWSDALGQWQPQPSPVTRLGDLTDVILTHPRPTDHLIFDGRSGGTVPRVCSARRCGMSARTWRCLIGCLI